MDANAKLQFQSDSIFRSLGLEKVPEIFQLFIGRDQTGAICIGFIKIVDEIQFSRPDDTVRKFVADFENIFTIGTLSHGPGRLWFYGLNIIQNEDYTCLIEGGKKLAALSSYHLTRVRRRQGNENMNQSKMNDFILIYSFIQWVGTTASALCLFYTNYSQQMLKESRVSAFVVQTHFITKIRRINELYLSCSRICS